MTRYPGLGPVKARCGQSKAAGGHDVTAGAASGPLGKRENASRPRRGICNETRTGSKPPVKIARLTSILAQGTARVTRWSWRATCARWLAADQKRARTVGRALGRDSGMRNRLRAGVTGTGAAGCWALAWLAPGVRAEILLSFAALTLTLGAGGLLVLPSRFACFMAGLRGAEILTGRGEDSAGPDGDKPILTMLRDASRGRLERHANAQDEDPRANTAGLA